MDTEEKMMWTFTQVHGEVGGSCYTEIEYDEECEPYAIAVMKDGNLCWRATKTDILFEYVTIHLNSK